MAITLKSVFQTAANNIVSTAVRSKGSLETVEGQYNDIASFLYIRKKQVESIKLPDKKKITQIANINIASNSGAPSNSFGSSFGGGLGLAGAGLLGMAGVVGAVAGTTNNNGVKQKLERKLKTQEASQKASVGKGNFEDIITKFSSAVSKFEKGVLSGLFGNVTQQMNKTGDWGQGETEKDQKFDYKNKGTEITPTGTGDEVFPLPSGNPKINTTTGYMGGTFSSTRDKGRPHHGQDIGVDPNSPVVATRTGKVIDKYNNYGGHGDALIIKYDNGQQGLYGHINAQAKIGDIVKSGQQIGTVKDWGENTHLHYMRKDTKGQDIDPLPYLQSSKSGVPKVQPKKEENKKDLQKQSQFTKEGSADQKVNTIKKQQSIEDFIKGTKSGDRILKDPKLKAQLTGQKYQFENTMQTTPVTDPEVKQAQQMYNNYVRDIRSRQQDQIKAQMVGPAAPVQVPQIAQYPSYSQSQFYIIDRPSVIAMGGGGGSSQPVNIPSGGGGGGGGTTVLSGPSEGEVVNSLIKTLLLTNLSAS